MKIKDLKSLLDNFVDEDEVCIVGDAGIIESIEYVGRHIPSNKIVMQHYSGDEE